MFGCIGLIRRRDYDVSFWIVELTKSHPVGEFLFLIEEISSFRRRFDTDETAEIGIGVAAQRPRPLPSTTTECSRPFQRMEQHQQKSNSESLAPRRRRREPRQRERLRQRRGDHSPPKREWGPRRER